MVEVDELLGATELAHLVRCDMFDLERGLLEGGAELLRATVGASLDRDDSVVATAPTSNTLPDFQRSTRSQSKRRRSGTGQDRAGSGQLGETATAENASASSMARRWLGARA